jgi:hypothetical protein
MTSPVIARSAPGLSLARESATWKSRSWSSPRGAPGFSRPTVPVAVSPASRGFWSFESHSPSAPKKTTTPAPQAAPTSCGCRPKNPVGAAAATGAAVPFLPFPAAVFSGPPATSSRARIASAAACSSRACSACQEAALS